MRVTVEVIDEAGVGCCRDAVAEIVRAVLGAEKAQGAVTVAYVDERTISELNGRYRGEHEATDVLSFGYADDGTNWPEWPSPDPYSEIGQIDADAAVAPDLGEIVICPEVVRRHAREEGSDTGQQLGKTIIHGVLHLLGRDHERDRGEMRRRERELLQEFAPLVEALSPFADV